MNNSFLKLKKTEYAICRTFAELLCQKPLDKITIRELAEKSSVTRGTIYNYFFSIYNLYEVISEIVIEDIMNQQKGFLHYRMSDADFQQPNPFILRSFNYLSETKIEHQALWQPHSPAYFKDKARELIRENIFGKLIFDGKIDKNISYTSAFITDGFISLQTNWLYKECSFSTDEITLLATDLCFKKYY